MKIDIERAENIVKLFLNGRLDTISAPEFEALVLDELEKGNSLILDFSDLEYISSAGLRVLLKAQKKLQNGTTMKLTGVCEDVFEVLEITGFTKIMSFC